MESAESERGPEARRARGAEPKEEWPKDYRSATETVGVIRRTDLAVVAMWGRDPIRMLNGLITNDLLRLTPEASVYAALLTPKGRMIADLRVVHAGVAGDSAELLAVVPAIAASAVGEHLRKYVPPLFARWEDRSSEVAVLTVLGPLAAAVVEALLDAPPLEAAGTVSSGTREGVPIRAIAEPIGSIPAFHLLVPAATADAIGTETLREASRLGGGEVGAQALETVRVEAGVPTFGREMTEESLPAEAFESTGRMADAVSFSKGCYTGQEVVVRIAHRGHVNRHVRGILLNDAAPEAGATLHHAESGREVGRITTVARSPRMGGQIALGIVRREIGPGDRVHISSPDGPVGEVTDLPFRIA